MSGIRVAPSMYAPPGGVTDRRRAARVPVHAPTVIVELENTPAMLVNLSFSGAQVDTAMPVRPGQTLMFKIGYAGETLQPALARAQWVSNSDLNGFRVGVAFETWDVRQLKGLVDYCRWYQPVD